MTRSQKNRNGKCIFLHEKVIKLHFYSIQGSHHRQDGSYFGNDRYSKGYRDSNSGLEDAYRKGLESVIHESIQSPSRFSHRRDYQQDHDLDFNRRPYGGKYGLYQAAPDFYSRSTNTTIVAEKP